MDRRALLRSAGAALVTGAMGGCLGEDVLPNREAPTSTTDGACAAAGATLTQPGTEYVVVVDDDTAQGHPVTLTNATACELRVDTADWRLEQRTSSGWSTVQKGEDGETRRLVPDETHDWSLSVEPHPTPGPVAEETTFVFFEEAPEGRYAFTVRGTLERSDAETSLERGVEFALRRAGSTTTASST